MKNSSTPESERRLSEALDQWVVDAPLPPRFREQVWQRIARSEVRPQVSFWAGLVQLVEGFFSRPRVAYSYVAVLLAFGVAAGAWTAQVKSDRMEASLGERYVKTIAPYQFPGSTP